MPRRFLEQSLSRTGYVWRGSNARSLFDDFDRAYLARAPPGDAAALRVSSRSRAGR